MISNLFLAIIIQMFAIFYAIMFGQYFVLLTMILGVPTIIYLANKKVERELEERKEGRQPRR